MEAEQQSCAKVNSSIPRFSFLLALVEKLHACVTAFTVKVKSIGQDDPRRISHSFKVGLALTLVSVFYYVNPLFDGFGSSTMWAVLTVVVVMEYTVGGTLGKGLNRAFATLIAGALGLGAQHVAAFVGVKGEPVILGVFVFVLASAATFSRFIPVVKKRYDYGVTIFILTFSLVAVSSYRAEKIIQVAQQRLATIALGVAVCLATTIFVFPVWAGEDLHNLTATNLEKLATFSEGLENKYFGEEEKITAEDSPDKSYLRSYKSVLDSKPTEDSLVNFAKWEPGHGRFGFRHPWDQYLRIGASARRCAYSMDSLTAFIATVDKSTPFIGSNPPPKPDSDDLRSQIRSACVEMCSEFAEALSDLASSIRSMVAPAGARHHMAAASAAAERMKSVLSDGPGVPGIMYVAILGSLIVEIVRSGEQIVSTVDELARLAGFESTEAESQATEKPVADGECRHVVIAVEE